ncbi:MAG: SDR family NAD(P)-dependent oxidoreductase [Chloroflexota bacterium]
MPRVEQKRMPRRDILWIDEKTASKDLSDRVYIVTGANSGVGLETTRQLIKQGGHVIMACRRTNAGEEVAKSYAGLKGSYEVMKLDLADLQSVREFVVSFLDEYDQLDGLACNAGMVNMSDSEPQYTKDGLEVTIGISYFGHFLLTELLLNILKESAPSRMVILSSVVHAGSEGNRPAVHLEDINFKSRPYGAMAAYGEAKVAVVLYAKELAKRLEGTGVSVFSVHPGWARSNFGSGARFPLNLVLTLMRPLTRSMSDTSEESAQTSLHCLLSDDAPEHSGAYFSQSSVLYRDARFRNGGWPMESPNPDAKNMDTTEILVQLSYELVGMQTR